MAGEWPLISVGAVAESISKTYKCDKDFLVFLNTSDVLFGKILHHDYSMVKDWPGQAKKSICRGDILFSEIRPANGRYAFVNIDAEDYVVSTKLMVIRAKKNQIFPRYLYRFLTSKKTTEWLQYLAESRSGTFPQITFDQVADLEILLPPKQSQSAIAAFFDTLDDKIELNRKMNETLEAMARALFKSWFVDFDLVRAKAEGRKPVGLSPEIAKLFPDSFEQSELGEIPKGWKVGILGDFGTIVTGKTPSTKVLDVFGSDILFLTPSDIENELITFSVQRHLSNKGLDLVRNCLVPAGTVCVTCIGSDMGKTVLTGQSLVTNQQLNSLIPAEHYFTNHVLFSIRGRKEELQLLGSSGSTMPILNKGHFSLVQIIRPPDIVLQRFQDSTEVLINRIKQNQEKTCTLTSLRDILLPKLLSGEICIKDAEKFLEKAL